MSHVISQAALERFEQAAGPDHRAERRFALGCVALAAGQWHQAERAFREALGPGAAGQPPAQHPMPAHDASTRTPEPARPDPPARGDHPMHRKMRHGLAQALTHQGALPEAIALFEALVAERPDLLDPRVWLGVALLQAGRLQEALQVHRQALIELRAHPEIARVIADGAVALDRLYRHREGADWCRAGLALLPAPEPTVCLNLAAFLLRLGDKAAARDALRMAAGCGAEPAAQAARMWASWGDGGPL